MLNLMPYRKNENSLFNYLDSLEKDFFGDLSTSISHFRTDIADRGDYYELKADLPGFKKEEIKIDLSGTTMSIQAEHKEETEEKKKDYIRRERKYGSFARSFDVTGIDTENITASLNDGVLELKLPKATPAGELKKQITVE